MALVDCPENSTGMAVFQLLGFHGLPGLKPLMFLLFFSIYLFTVAGNSLILFTVVSDVRLHSPMYFFLGNLSTLEICYTNTIIPTLLGSHLGQGFSIPHHGCILQMGVFTWFTASECFLLTAMAYDRYVAICHPLRYTVLMNRRLCLNLAASTWVTGFLISMTNSIFLFRLQFPDRNQMDHFVCDFLPLLKLTCSDTSQIQMECFIFSFIVISFPFVFVIVSYVYIISTILKIPSTTGKNKAFSTCSSHLTIVITYFGILTLMYTVPTANKSQDTDKALSLPYTVGTPLFNPIVYTLRNKEMKDALKSFLNQNVFLPMTFLHTSEKQGAKNIKRCLDVTTAKRLDQPQGGLRKC